MNKVQHIINVLKKFSLGCEAVGVPAVTGTPGGSFRFLQCVGEKSCGFAVPQTGPQRAPAVRGWRHTADANWRSAAAEPGP